MKRNLIVLIGAAILVVSALFLPMITFTETFVGQAIGSVVGIYGTPSIFVAIAILVIMLWKWKWRGVVWIVLSIAGVIWIFAAISQDETRRQTLTALNIASFGEPSYTAGMYLIPIGFAIIIAGSIWDVVQKRKAKGNIPRITK